MTKVVKYISHLYKEAFNVQPLRFLLSSGLATISHWFVMVMMIIAGTAPTIATAVGAFIGAVTNYFLQHKVTFRTNLTLNHHFRLLRYIFVCALIWLFNFVFFFMLYRTAMLPIVVAQGATTLTIALMSYFLYKRIVFNEH